MDEKELAKNCESWTRYEYQIGGDKAHQVSAQLKQINNDEEYKDFLISLILDRYGRFYTAESKKGKENRPTKETKMLVDLMNDKSFSFQPVNNEDRKLTDTLDYLAENSGLFSTFYKANELFGDGSDLKIMAYLLTRFREEFVPSDNLKSWVNKHKPIYDEFTEQYDKDIFEVLEAMDEAQRKLVEVEAQLDVILCDENSYTKNQKIRQLIKEIGTHEYFN